ncbi:MULTISPECIES: hypothetical protein [Nocardiaceae]|uniref:hypothetical protein n=1 Tax=Nocardiaceae TaxID=85025 RepID=UPI000A7C1471|nr:MULTISPECIES: hypothetical protein [Rhodococcus]
MTNPQLSLVAALLDRSGSMHSIADDTRGGFDSFIAKEREADGRTVVTLAQFDHRYELVYDNTPIEDVGRSCSSRGAAPRCTTQSAGSSARWAPVWPRCWRTNVPAR